MKNKTLAPKSLKTFAAGLALALGLSCAGGCGAQPAAEVDIPRPEPIAAPNSVESPDETQQSSDTSSETDQDPAPGERFPPQSDSHLDGTVKTIGEDSFVVSQHFEIPVQEEGTSMVVAPADGSPDEVLITVHITESTDFEIHTVRNGGTGGDADVEKQSGSFSDIGTGNSLNMDGHYEGDDFHADFVVIYRFV